MGAKLINENETIDDAMDCPTCEKEANAEPVPRWKAPLLFAGALLFCPCHLPATFAVLAALGTGLTGAAWLFANKALVYGTFSVLYLVLLVLLYRWFLSSRDRERRLEDIHQAHAAQE